MKNVRVDGKIIVLILAMMLLIYGMQSASYGQVAPLLRLVRMTRNISMMASIFALLQGLEAQHLAKRLRETRLLSVAFLVTQRLGSDMRSSRI